VGYVIGGQGFMAVVNRPRSQDSLFCSSCCSDYLPLYLHYLSITV